MQGPYNIVHSHWVVNMIKMRFVHTQLNIIKCKNTYVFHKKEKQHFTFLQHFGQNIPSDSILKNYTILNTFSEMWKNLYILQKLSDIRRIHDLDHSSKRNILVDATQLTIVHKWGQKGWSMISVENKPCSVLANYTFWFWLKINKTTRTRD